MASPGMHSSLRVSGVVTGAVDAVLADPRMVAVTLVGNLLGVIPIIGSLLSSLANGIAVILATKTFDETHRPEKDFAARAVYLVVATLVAGILIIIGLLLLILPGIYLIIRFALFPAAVMVDDRGPLEGLSASWDRTKGHGLTVFGFMLAVFLPGILLTVVLYLTMFGFQSPTRINTMSFSLMAGVIGAPFNALNAGGVAVMYDAFEP